MSFSKETEQRSKSDILLSQDKKSFSLGRSIDYRLGLHLSSEEAKRIIDKNSIVKIINFPLDRRALADFGSTLGRLMPKHTDKANTIEDFIGIVRLRSDIEPEERFATQDNSELNPHTAHSWGIQRPRYFGLLMVNPGWRDETQGERGESMYVRLKDALEEMKKQFPETYEEDIQLLRYTKVEFFGKRKGANVSNMPILFPIDENGTLGFRYKENMLEDLEELTPFIPNGDRYFQAAQRFDKSLLSSSHIIQLTQGDLIILDNRLIAHARKPFVAERIDNLDQISQSPRLLYSMHVHPDIFDKNSS